MGDLANSPYISRKRGNNDWRMRLPFSARRSTQLLGVVILFALLLTFTWHHQGQFSSGDTTLIRMPISAAGEKFAIVTFETRDVTYWRESLGNKMKYARMHG